jgi:phytanoyl-CoA hydroxylase
VPKEDAWFDAPNALETIKQNSLSGLWSKQDADLAEHWVKEGWLIIENVIPASDIDAMNAFYDQLWTAKKALPIVLEGFTLEPERGPRDVEHRELLPYSPEERIRMSKVSSWRIHGLSAHVQAADRIFRNERLKSVCSLIFGKPAIPQYTINFYIGSRQELHQDMMVFHIHPGNNLIGAWIALEDIHDLSTEISQVSHLFCVQRLSTNESSHDAAGGRAEALL